MSEPLCPQDPRVLGPFRIRGRLDERDAGLVFAGEDAFGRDVAVAVLHPAAAADPAVRDRFEAAVAPLAADGTVPGSGVRDEVAWAAVAPGVDGDAGAAAGLLDAVSLTSGGGGAGPTFVPHWASVPDKGWVRPEPAPARPEGRGGPVVAGLGIAAVTVLLAVAVIYSLGVAEWGDGDRAASGGVRASGEAGASEAPVPSPSPTRTAGDGPPGPVAGPTFGKGEDRFRMKLKGFPFEFDAPGTWGCMNSDEEPFDSRWICVDDGGDLGGAGGSGAGGMVAVHACPKPCGDGERATMREALAVETGDWRSTDATTMYAEVEGEDEGERVVRVAMSHVFGDGRTPDTGVAVVLTGPVGQRPAMQKLINEIRERAS